MSERDPGHDPLSIDNIEAVATLEREAYGRRTGLERASDRITALTGRIGFVVLNVGGFIIWVLVNCGLVQGVRPFDPFPFSIFALLLSAEGVFLAIFILISQNRIRRQSDLRDHLNLQVTLLAERETTKVLRVLEDMRHDLGIHRHDPETERMKKDIEVTEIARALQEKIPPEDEAT